MYTLPRDFSPQSLTMKLLVEVCCNANQIRFVFDLQTKIVLEGRCQLRKVDAQTPIAIEPPLSEVSVLQLIGCGVVDATVDQTRSNLILSFSSGDTLTFIGEDPYECYLVTIEGKEFRV